MSIMLDIKFVRDNPDVIKENLTRRGELDKISWVDDLLNNDRSWRSISTEANNLRNKRNKLTEEIAKQRRQGADVSLLVKDAEQIPEQIKTLEKQV